jgi:hypothetical protein
VAGHSASKVPATPIVLAAKALAALDDQHVELGFQLSPMAADSVGSMTPQAAMARPKCGSRASATRHSRCRRIMVLRRMTSLK